MQAFLTIAVRAARKAGELLVRESEKIRSEQSNSQNEFVTKINLAAESTIIDTLSFSYKDHAFQCEESGQIGENDYQWIISPINGVNNFIRQIPHWSISIALSHKGRTVVAVVYDPLKEELFTAVQGRGVQMNGKRLRVSKTQSLEHSMLSTGFPFRKNQNIDNYMVNFAKIFPQCLDIRRSGSTALDLAYVAAGRIDGFWEHSVNQWDTVAGVLLVTEAGGMVSDTHGNPNYLKSDSILTANPKIFKLMLQAMKYQG